MASVGSYQKLLLCLTEPVPAGSKTDLLLSKAELTSNDGSVSEITYLIMGKKTCATAVAAGEMSEKI